MTTWKSPDSEFIGSRVAVVCPVCSKTKWYSPAVAARRKYCDHVCFMGRPTVTLAQSIINDLGGRTQLASLLTVKANTVKSWSRNGIPQRFHLIILRLAKERGLSGVVTLGKLQKTQEIGKAHRRG